MIRRGKDETFELVRDFADRKYNHQNSLFWHMVFKSLPEDDQEVNIMKNDFAPIFKHDKFADRGGRGAGPPRKSEYNRGGRGDGGIRAQEGVKFTRSIGGAAAGGAGGEAVGGERRSGTTYRGGGRGNRGGQGGQGKSEGFGKFN